MRNNNVKKLTQSSILLAFAIILQLIGRNFVNINPLLIGPLISTIILLTTYICGLTYGILISLLIPLSAILIGALATPLIPFAPFIVIGNIIFCAGFAITMKKGRVGLYVGVIIATIVKVVFFSISATKLIYMFNLGLSPQIAKMIGAAFTTPQIPSSLLGGAVAIIAIEILAKRKVVSI